MVVSQSCGGVEGDEGLFLLRDVPHCFLLLLLLCRWMKTQLHVALLLYLVVFDRVYFCTRHPVAPVPQTQQETVVTPTEIEMFRILPQFVRFGFTYTD